MEPLAAPEGTPADDWAATPAFIQQAFVALLTIVAQQQLQLAQLQAQLAEQQARLNQHSQNSSKPPSSDPPSAPPRPARVPRGRAKGAQPGHERHLRPTPDPDQISEVRDHYPQSCPHCQASLSSSWRDACAVQTQYVWELPVVEPLITAHHFHTLCCRSCGDLVTANRPADLPPGSFGARIAASVALLHGRYRISDREIPLRLCSMWQAAVAAR